MNTTRLSRGDWNADKTKRFWGYIRGVEGWLSTEKFSEAQWRTSYWLRIASSNLSLLRKLRKEHQQAKGNVKARKQK